MSSVPVGETDSSVARIYLLDGSVAVVDRDDEVKLLEYRWRLLVCRNKYYARANIGRREVLMHRFIFGAEHGSIVDHINMNGLDNRKSNLRYASRSHNGANTKKLNTHGATSVYKGVYLETYKSQNSRWRARVKVNGKRINLGSFDTETDAALAYDAAAKEHFGEFARLNFPQVEGQH